MNARVNRRRFLCGTGGVAAGAAVLAVAGSGPGPALLATAEPVPGDGPQQLVNDQIVYGTSYVSPQVEVFGQVFIGQGSFIASNTILRAAPDQRVEIGNGTNAQDNIVIRALDGAMTVGDDTSLAHHAVVRDSDLGSFVFIGFQAQVIDSIVGDGCLVQAGAKILGVELPPDSVVAPGQVVDTQALADALPKVDEMGVQFQRDVLHVNSEFATGYIELFETEGYTAVLEIGPNPQTEFLPDRVEPQLGENVVLGEFVRIVGDVRIGDNSRLRQRTAVRADEGSPIVIGSAADIGNRVTFHALEFTQLTIGSAFTVDDDAVIHGPLQVGSGVTVGDSAVVFRVVVEDGVQIGANAIVQGPAGDELTLVIPAGARIPAGAVVTDEDSLRQAIGG